jgi:hypothetical protein
MSCDKVVLAVNVVDNADTLREFLDWYQALGVDFIVAFDSGSTDGSRNILDEYARSGALSWMSQPRKNIDGFDPFSELARIAHDRFEADWIILADADEFLCITGESLHSILQEAKRDEISVLSVPRFNMTGTPPAPGQNALEMLNLRIDKPFTVSRREMLSGDIKIPQIFAPIRPKTIVLASSFVEYGAGAHTATSSSGQTAERAELRMLHYPFRSYEEFEKKVENITVWMAANTHLPPSWGWHWRRYIRLREEGRLKQEFDEQFVSLERARELIEGGSCSVDDVIASWVRRSLPRPA